MSQEIKKYDFKGKENLEFEILDIESRFIQKHEMMTTPHRAQFYHIMWIEEGRGNHIVDFNTLPIQDNTIIFIPQNSVNCFDPKGVYKGKAIIFTDAFFCRSTEDSRFLNTTPLFSDLYDFNMLKFNKELSILSPFVNAMMTEYKRSSDSAQFQILRHLLYIFLLQSERELKRQGFEEIKPSVNLEYLLSFKDLLEQNFRSSKTVKTYASALSLSEKQLHKATTTVVDKTPKQLIDERIVLEAKRLLVHSTSTIKEVAYELGFEEPTNFIKYFRKHTNITPVEFRDQH